MNKQLITLPLSDIKEYENNNKIHADNIDEIVKSIKRNTYIAPIIVDEDNVILVGHGRKLALQKMGDTKAEVLQVTGLSEEQKADYRITDNKLSELSEWNIEAIMEEIELHGLDEVAALFELDTDVKDLAEDKEDDIPEIDDDNIIVQQGDLFKLGDHYLLCGDCTHNESVEALMKSGILADLIVTDPPYNVNYQGKTGKKLTIQNDNKEQQEFIDFLTDSFTTMDSILKPGGVFYIRHADSEGYSFRTACELVQRQVRQCLIRNKNSFVMGRQDYHRKHEPCLYGWKNGKGHLWNTDRKQTTVLDFDKPSINKEHPTMKPVEIISYMIENSSKKGEIVADFFIGSGTTMIACEKTGRICYGMEIDERYVQVILRRFYEYTKGQQEIVCMTRPDLDLKPIFHDNIEED